MRLGFSGSKNGDTRRIKTESKTWSVRRRSVKWKEKRVKRDKGKVFREWGEDEFMEADEETLTGGGDSLRHG
jgi:hypothetical protein